MESRIECEKGSSLHWQEEVGREDKKLLVQLFRLCPAHGHPAKEVRRGCNIARLFFLAMNPGNKLCERCPKHQRWPSESSAS